MRCEAADAKTSVFESQAMDPMQVSGGHEAGTGAAASAHGHDPADVAADATAYVASRATGASGAAAARCNLKRRERETVTAFELERVCRPPVEKRLSTAQAAVWDEVFPGPLTVGPASVWDRAVDARLQLGPWPTQR